MIFRTLLALVLSCNLAFAQTLFDGSAGGGGGGGTPGGSNTQLQYNNAGSFGGTSGATTDGITVTLVAPILGTPASGTLTNAIGLPISTGVSGLGTGVSTALGVNVGSAGALVVNGGALGIPSSGTLTNATGLPIAGITGLGSGVATALSNTAGGAGGFALVGTNPYNLTGPITSVGNATSIASQTGTGTTFVMSAAPTITGAVTASGTIAISGATIGTNALAAGGMIASIGASGTSPGFYSYLNTDTVARVRIGMDISDIPSLAFGPGGVSARDTFLYRSGAAALVMGSTTTLSDASLTLGRVIAGTSVVISGASIGSDTLAWNGTATGSGRLSISGITNTGNGAASISNSLWNGTVFTGGSATTTFPAMFIQPAGTSAVTTWSTSGTGLGMNLASGFAGNFLDFHVAGAGSMFSVDSSGIVTTGSNVNSGGRLQASQSSVIQWNGRGILTSPIAGSVQLGNVDNDLNASIVAQTLRSQGALTGGTTNQAGKDWTFIASPSKGNVNGGGYIFQVTPAGASSSTVNVPVTVFAINGGGTSTISAATISSANFFTTGLITDATKTTATLCADTTTGQVYKGSGAIGVCLGTSSMRYKHDIKEIEGGLDQIVALAPKNYRYNKGYIDNGDKEQYGFIAEDVIKILPDCVGLDNEGNANTVDPICIFPFLVKSIQELNAKLDKR